MNINFFSLNSCSQLLHTVLLQVCHHTLGMSCLLQNLYLYSQLMYSYNTDSLMLKYNTCNLHKISCSRQLLAPPPSRVSSHVRPPPQTVVAVKKVRTPTPVQTPVEQKNKIVADFLNRVLFGINKGVYRMWNIVGILNVMY